jgi:class 3 adenylate cyclase/tetratricopeptide (TPR) repeat protein
VVTLFLRFQGIDYDHDEAGYEKLDRYIRWIQGVVNRYEGHLLQITIGDKGSYTCIAFGAPIAHEDDAIRAVSSALELSKPPQDLAFIKPAQIGVAQGQMLAGAYGSPSRRTYGAMSDEINLSARLMEAAAPGQVLASQVTSQATEGLYSWERLPALALKGKSEPVPVYALSGPASQFPERLQASRYAVPMVGRQIELEQIGLKWRLADLGQGQVIGIFAEAGMGKSRLIAEATSLLEDAGFDFFIGECQSFGTHSGYLVWQPIWRGLFGLDPAAGPDIQIQRLAEALERLAPGLVPRLPLLGTVLSLPIPDNELTRSFDAKLRKTSTESLLVECLQACAREKPVLLVLEDCHWLDPLSRDLLETIGRAIANLRVLLITASRPIRQPELDSFPLSRLPHFSEILLADFTRQEAERLVRLKLELFFGPHTKAQPRLAERIIQRADGNPFYIEELLNYLITQGFVPEDQQSLEHLDLPTSLHSLILSRIDQLTESQVAALKVASVIGRLFKAAMLWGVYPALGDGQRVIADLESLRRMELMELESEQPELTYLFKQVITQEVAYESLPYATRATLHEQIGRFIERSFSDRLDQYLDLLAFHFERSADDEKKRAYLLRAGEAAQAKYANTAAIEYYRRLIPLLDAKNQVAVRLKLGQVLVLVGEWQAAGEVLLQAMDSAEDLADYPALNWCRAAIADLMGKQGQYAEASEWLEFAQAGFQSLGDMTGVGKVLHSRGTLAAQQGDFKRSQALYEQSLAIRRQMGDLPQVASLLSNLAILARLRGEYARARALHEEGLALRRELGDRWAIANSLNNLGNVALDQQDYGEARACLEEAVALLREIGDRWAIANSLNNLGNVARTQGDFQAARGLYLESLQIYREFGDQRALAYLLEDIAGLAAQQGQAEQALILVGCAAGLRLAIGSPLSPTEAAKLDQLLEPAHQKLDELAQAAAWGQGRDLSLAEVIQVALTPTG